MKKPLIISIEQVKASILKFRQSPEYQAKINEARQIYEKDKIWLDPLLGTKK
jgi:hypothetical protein